MIKNKKILILGMARSGYEVAKLLSSYDNEIIITDNKEQDIEKVEELKQLNIKVIISDEPETLLDGIELMIKNPGIRRDQSAVLKAKELGIEVINEVEASYKFLPKNVKIIGITGSNGKTTTTTIIYESLKRANYPVHLAGNIGIPLSSKVNDIKEGDYLVIEISDHQLVDMYEFKTNISVLTNIIPAHLDFHESYDQYKAMKKKIFNHHTNSDVAIINNENQESLLLTNDIKSTKYYFSTKENKDAYLSDNNFYYQGEMLFNIDDMKIKGMHNYENTLCAILVLKSLNADIKYLKEFLNDFNGVEHRIEYVTKINNTSYYNDSKSTNTESTITALKALDKSMLLILGGLDRGHSFEPLNDYLNNVLLIISYGECKDRIKEWSKSQNIECLSVDNIKEAVTLAKEKSENCEVVLLSPACASWDQYDNFEQRGEDYKTSILN